MGTLYSVCQRMQMKWRGLTMSYFNNRKAPASEQVYAETMVWQCSECSCWSRPEFITEEEPNCPICHNRMVQTTKNIRVQ